VSYKDKEQCVQSAYNPPPRKNESMSVVLNLYVSENHQHRLGSHPFDLTK
jgi:hypothetical protein